MKQFWSVTLYDVDTRSVIQNKEQIADRRLGMALGARARDVVRMVLPGTSWNVGGGLLAGVLLCLIFDNVASRWVTESSRDPLILGGVPSCCLPLPSWLVLRRRAARPRSIRWTPYDTSNRGAHRPPRLLRMQNTRRLQTHHGHLHWKPIRYPGMTSGF